MTNCSQHVVVRCFEQNMQTECRGDGGASSSDSDEGDGVGVQCDKEAFLLKTPRKQQGSRHEYAYRNGVDIAGSSPDSDASENVTAAAATTTKFKTAAKQSQIANHKPLPQVTPSSNSNTASTDSPSHRVNALNIAPNIDAANYEVRYNNIKIHE